MKRLILRAALAAGPVTAEGVGESCAAISNDTERLNCYDAAFKSGPEEVTKELPQTGSWVVDITQSEFEDTTDVFLSLDANSLVQCRRHSPPAQFTLVVRCKENTTSIFFAGDCHFAEHDGLNRGDYRVDSEPSRKTHMLPSNGKAAIGHWRGTRSTPIIENLLGGDRLLIRVAPFGMSPITAEFDITGLDEAIKPLRASCGW